MNVSDLRKMLGMPDLPSRDETTYSNDISNQSEQNTTANQANATRDSSSRQIRVRRQSMEQLDLIKVLFASSFFLFFIDFFIVNFTII